MVFLFGGVPPPNAKCAKKVEKRPFSRPPPGTPKKGSGGGPCPRSPFKLVKSSKFDVSLIRGGTPPNYQSFIKSWVSRPQKHTPPPPPPPPPPPSLLFSLKNTKPQQIPTQQKTPYRTTIPNTQH